MAIERPGPDRVPPPCPLFGTLRRLPVAARDGWPRSRRPSGRSSSARSGCRSPDGASRPGPPFGYRDRAKLAVGRGRARSGFRARRSHDVVDVAGAARCSAPSWRARCRRCAARRAGWRAGVELDVQAGNDGVHVNVAHADPTSAAHARREIDRLRRGGRRRAVAGGQADARAAGRRRRRARVAAAARAGRTGSRRWDAPATRRWSRPCVEAVGPVAGRGAGALRRQRQLHPPPGRGGATAVSACDGDPAAIERGAPQRARGRRGRCGRRAVDADTVVLDPPREGADRAHLTAAPRRAPAHRLRVVRSADAGPRRAPAARGGVSSWRARWRST